MSAPDFWDDQNAARALMAEVNPLKHRMEAFSALKSRLEDIDAAIELAQEADDDDLGREAVEAIAEYDENLASLNAARAQGKTTQEWFAQHVQQSGLPSDVLNQQLGEADRKSVV